MYLKVKFGQVRFACILVAGTVESDSVSQAVASSVFSEDHLADYVEIVYCQANKRRNR